MRSLTVGYYAHHLGAGHVQRAAVLAAELSRRGARSVGLSSAARPAGWAGEWVRLPRDDGGRRPRDVSPGGALHWVPRDDDGLRRRHRALSAWIDRARPQVVVCDVSVEVAVLVRLHGVPVVTVVPPGERRDRPHRLGFDLSDALLGFYPEQALDALVGLAARHRRKLTAVGAVSRFAVRRGNTVPRTLGRRAVALGGRGGAAWDDEVQRQMLAATPGWHWTVLGDGRWTGDPEPHLARADVVVTHAGESCVAEVAALRRPAVVVPAARPHREQTMTGSALAAGPWPVEVVQDARQCPWATVVDRAAGQDGSRWAGWCDGRAAARAADVIEEVARA